MNDARRKELKAIREKLSDIFAELESIRDDEEEAFDNMPESFQNSERGEKAQEAIYHLNGAVSGVEAILDDIESSYEG